jgi:hypothetical protein
LFIPNAAAIDLCLHVDKPASNRAVTCPYHELLQLIYLFLEHTKYSPGVLALLLHIWEVPGSNTVSDTCYRD